LEKVVFAEPTPLRRLRPEVPRDLETICLKCLQKEPRKRYGNAAELAEDLRRFLAGEPVIARPIGAWERGLRWVQRRPAVAALLGVSGLAALALVGVLVGLVYNAHLQVAFKEATEQRGRAEQQEELAERRQADADEQRQRAEAKTVEADKQRQLAQQQHGLAVQERQRAERLQYAADVNLARQAFQENRLFRMRELLLRYAKADHLKGFEWDYLWQLCRLKLVLGPQHPKPVRAIAFSPDGRRAVSGSDGGTLKIWDTATGQEQVPLAGHPKSVSAVAFRPDGRAVASASWDGTVKVWDAATGQELYGVSDAEGSLNSVAFSPDGRLLAYAGDADTIILCDAQTGNRHGRWSGHGGTVQGLAFSPDGKMLASASADETVKLWDVQAGKQVRTLEGHKSAVNAVAFSPDGHWLASGNNLGSAPAVMVWDLATGKATRTYTDHTLSICGVAFSPDGRRLASSSGDGTIRIREFGGDELATVLYGPGGIVFGGAFSPDGTRLVLAVTDGSVAVWDSTVDGDTMGFGWLNKESGLRIAQSPDGRWLATAGDKAKVVLWDPQTGQSVRTFEGHIGKVEVLAFSPDGRRLLSAGADKVVRIWRVEDGQSLLEYPGHDSSVRSAAYDPLGRFVATGDVGGTIRVWDPETGHELTSLTPHQKGGVNQLAFRPDGRRLASAGQDKTLLVWDTATWKVVRTWADHSQPLGCVAYSPDSRRLAGGLLDGLVVVRGEDGDEPLFLRGHNGAAFGLTFSPDGRRLASGGIDQQVRIWDMENGQPLLTLQGNSATTLLFSPDGERLMAGSDRGVGIWHAAHVPGAGEPVPRRWLDWYRSQARDCDKAKQWFAEDFFCCRLLEADPGNEAKYRKIRAIVAAKQNDFRRAEADLTRVLELEPPTAAVLNARGQAWFNSKEYDRSEADQTRAVEIDPKHREAWLDRGETRARLGRWADAIADYTRALELNDKGASAWRLRGVARAELGQWDEAIGDFAEAVERGPTSRRDLVNLAEAYLGRGDLPAHRRACVSLYERLGHTDLPQNWNSLSWVCSLAVNDGIEPGRLVRLMDKAVAAEPNKYPFLNTRGAVLYRAGRYQDAIDQLNAAVQAHAKGGSFEDWVFLAMAEFRLGHAERAQEDLERATTLYEEGLKPSEPGRPAADWITRLEGQQLRKEARLLLQNQKP
jgi:WD40 repeat protein/tetratricopeptide (TPR) repeat protein